MSQTLVCKTQIKNRERLEGVLRELGVPHEYAAEFRMFDGETIKNALLFTPEGWRHQVAVPVNGNLRYDNYEGHWGKEEELDKILQAYSVAELRHQAQLEGYIVTETKLDNGDIELVAEVYN